MRKIIYVASILALTITVIIGCKKTIKQEVDKQKITTQTTTSNQRTLAQLNVTTANNMLVFRNSDDYEIVVTTQEADERLVFLNDVRNMEFLSYAEVIQNQPDNDVIKDAFVSQILNQDFIVQIGAFLYKINAVTSKVYVLPVANINRYADLVNENMSNTNIKRYSTADNVIELVENGNMGGRLAGPFCGDTGIGSYHEQTYQVAIIPGGAYPYMNGYIYFNRFGVYFNLYSEVFGDGSNIAKVAIECDPIFYKQKCGSATAGPYTTSVGLTWNYAKIQSYQGSKNLNKLYFRARFKGQFASNNVTYNNTTSWIQVRVNY